MAGYNPGGFKISKKKVKEIIMELKLDKDETQIPFCISSVCASL